MKLKLNPKLLPMKAHYFFFNAGTAPILPYLPTYAKQLGISEVGVGTIYAILPVCGLLAKPAFGSLADRFQIQKLLYLIFIIVTAISFLGINFIPEMPPGGAEVELECGPSSWFKTCGHKDFCGLAINSTDEVNATMTCSSFCTIENEASLTEICTYWGLDVYCAGKVNSSDSGDFTSQSLSFDAHVPLDHVNPIGECLHLPISTITTSSDGTHVPYCKANHTSMTCRILCDNEDYMYKFLDVVNKEAPPSYFATFFILLVFSWVAMAVVVSIGDAICFELLGDKPTNYGQQRLWGSVGWGLLAVLSGYMVDYFSRGKMFKDYSPSFYLVVVLLAIDFLVSMKLRVVQTKRSPSIFADVSGLLRNIHIDVFVVWCIVVGMCTGLLWQFLFWYLEDLAKNYGCRGSDWIKLLEGLVMGIQCFGGEIPFFFISGYVIKHLGHINVMTLVLGVFGVRFILYSLIENPWMCLPIELLNGVTFGIFYATMTSYASVVAPPGTESTVQGLVGAAFEGIGVASGSFIGGWLYSSYGGTITFRAFGIAAVVLAFVHAIVQLFLPKRGDYSMKLQGNRKTLQMESPLEFDEAMEPL